MKRALTLTSFLVLMALSGAPAEAQSGAVVLRPGDQIVLRIWPDDNAYSGEYYVGTSGTLALPFLGEIQAAGVPVDQLEASIRSGYQATRRDVIVSIIPRFFVGVMGQVRSPSVYPVDPTQNLFNVVALAGGFNAEADQERVRIVRDGQVISVNALLSLETGVDINRYRLRSGDQIIVPTRGGISVRTVFEIVRTVSTLVLVYDRLANTN